MIRNNKAREGKNAGHLASPENSKRYTGYRQWPTFKYGTRLGGGLPCLRWVSYPAINGERCSCVLLAFAESASLKNIVHCSGLLLTTRDRQLPLYLIYRTWLLKPTIRKHSSVCSPILVYYRDLVYIANLQKCLYFVRTIVYDVIKRNSLIAPYLAIHYTVTYRK